MATYDAQELIRARMKSLGKSNSEFIVEKSATDAEEEYRHIFDDVQGYVVREKLPELNDSLSKGQDDTLMSIVGPYIKKKYTLKIKDKSTLDNIIAQCVADMTGFGFLNKYFAQKEDIEEININAWNTIEVRWRNGLDEITDDSFQSPQHAKDILSRILRTTGRFLDENRIYEITYIGKSVRMTVVTSPIVDPEIGVAASIRFIHSAIFDLPKLIESEFLTEEMANALVSFVNHGISVICCGATGSGKTTVLNALLEKVPDETRIITLEGGTREFELIRYDENGKPRNNRVHMQTRPHKDAKLNVDLQMLLDLNLKFDPDIVVVGEMVSEEAFIASEMARTGHTVLTTIHTNNARDAYYRMFTLGIRKYSLEKNLMMKFMCDAFPIVVYCKKYPDGVRRAQSIMAGKWDEETEKIVYTELYRFDVEDNVRSENGKIVTVGEFKKIGRIDNSIIARMLDNGATKADLQWM